MSAMVRRIKASWAILTGHPVMFGVTFSGGPSGGVRLTAPETIQSFNCTYDHLVLKRGDFGMLGIMVPDSAWEPE